VLPKVKKEGRVVKGSGARDCARETFSKQQNSRDRRPGRESMCACACVRVSQERELLSPDERAAALAQREWGQE